MSVSDLQLSPAVALTVVTAPASTSSPGAGQGRVSSDTSSSHGSDDAFFSLGTTMGTGGSWSGGNGSGGAPTPEVNAGLGLLLAGVTVAVLRRRRARRPARAS